MISKEILKKVRKIEITTRGLVNDVFSGQYHSVFKGRGIDFAEVREYQIGDDIRTIDWNVTARSGHPFVKTYEEERELSVMLLVDASASGDFGSASRMKGEIAVEICALLAFSAIKNNDKVGLLIFTDRIEKFVPPRKGKQHVLRVIRELLYHRPEHRGTDVGLALDYVNRVVRRRSVVFVVSDFISREYERSLRIANRRHDVVAIRVSDPREFEIPKVGLLELEDAESGERFLVDTSDPAFLEAYQQKTLQARKRGEDLFKSTKVDFIQVWTHQPYDAPLMHFFRTRAKRIR
ncbi:MAG: DUF58 domain-containing protein [Acidobacteriota bacterium]|nr:MAG: DUF58 domain-containing protein [Acidobacteriota bacterium]